jgi:hypothetical protein
MMPFNETATGRPFKIIGSWKDENLVAFLYIILDGLSIKYTHPETGLFHYVDRPECSAEHGCNSESVKIIEYTYVCGKLDR